MQRETGGGGWEKSARVDSDLVYKPRKGLTGYFSKERRPEIDNDEEKHFRFGIIVAITGGCFLLYLYFCNFL